MTSKRLNAGKLVRQLARERIGAPPGTRTIPNKKKQASVKHPKRELNRWNDSSSLRFLPAALSDALAAVASDRQPTLAGVR